MKWESRLFLLKVQTPGGWHLNFEYFRNRVHRFSANYRHIEVSTSLHRWDLVLKKAPEIPPFVKNDPSCNSHGFCHILQGKGASTYEENIDLQVSHRPC